MLSEKRACSKEKLLCTGEPIMDGAFASGGLCEVSKQECANNKCILLLRFLTAEL